MADMKRKKGERKEYPTPTRLVSVRLFADSPYTETEKADMQAELLDNNAVRFMVWTRAEERDKKLISFILYPDAVRAFIYYANKLIDQYTAENKSFKFCVNALGRPDDNNHADVDKTLWFGVSVEKGFWFAIQQKERPQIVFRFNIPEWNNLIWINGEKIDPIELSGVLAAGFLEDFRMNWSIAMSMVATAKANPLPAEPVTDMDDFNTRKGEKFSDVDL